MQLSSTLTFLVDAASETSGADRLLAGVGAHLVADGLPLAGGALTLSVPHPLIARRTWLWRAENGEVIEALGFVAGGLGPRERQAHPTMPVDAGSRGWLPARCMRTSSGRSRRGLCSSWIAPRPFTQPEADALRQAARFAAAPLAALAARATHCGGARGLSRPAQRRAGAVRSLAARHRRDHPGRAALCRSARLHRAVREQPARGGDRGAQ